MPEQHVVSIHCVLIYHQINETNNNNIPVTLTKNLQPPKQPPFSHYSRPRSTRAKRIFFIFTRQTTTTASLFSPHINPLERASTRKLKPY